MKSVVAIQHVHFDGLGTFEPVLREAGYGVTYVDVDRECATGEHLNPIAVP